MLDYRNRHTLKTYMHFTMYLTNIYGSETCEEQTLLSKTEHIICVEYKILGSSVTTAIAVEACASIVVMFLDAR